MSNVSIWPIDSILLGATISGQSRPESDGSDGVLRIPKSFSVRLCSVISRILVAEVGSYLSADMRSVYSTATAEWTSTVREL